METRAQKISRYISASRAEMQFGPLEVKLHNQTVNQWLERCRFIPDEFIDECYQMAMDAHATRSPMIPHQLYEQWMILRHQGAGKPREKQEKRCRFWCSEDGWIVLDAGGEMTPKDPRGKPEYYYAKPCPDHRPKGVRMSGADPTQSGLGRPRMIETMFVSGRKVHPGTSPGFVQMKEIAEQILSDAFEEMPPDNEIGEIPF